MVDLHKIIQPAVGNEMFKPPHRWFSRYVIAAMLVDSKQKDAH